jgi:hypothetical protein
MIQPLRQRHRRIFIALTVLLPILFTWGILGRRAIPLVRSGEVPERTLQGVAP